jgi:hypothetical protein
MGPPGRVRADVMADLVSSESCKRAIATVYTDSYASAADPETGGQYTVKLYADGTTSTGRCITLRPANSAFSPGSLDPSNDSEVLVLAGVVEVLGE